MDVDGEEEPEEIEGVSNLDFEDAAPRPAQMGAHSSVASEASSTTSTTSRCDGS